MSARLDSQTIIAVKTKTGWTPTPQMQGWWRTKMRGLTRPRALQPFEIADLAGKPTPYFMSLNQMVYGRNPHASDVAIIQDGKPTPEFLLVVNA